ncbi:MAG: hypothetical protein AMXMBFR47_08650 [Planctomycetota bacterium]
MRTWILALPIGLLCVGTALAQTGFVNWESSHVHPIALTPSGSQLLAVNTADNRLEVFGVNGGSVTRRRSIPVGLDPVSVRARTENQAWVVNRISDSISIVDLASGRVTRTLLTGDEPADVVFAGTPARAFVTISQLNQVWVYDPGNLAAAPTIINVQGHDPRALAVSGDGSRVYAAIFESGNRTTSIPRQVVSNPGSPYAGQNPPPNSGNAFLPPLAPGLPPPPPVGLILREDAAGRWRDDNSRDWTNFVGWRLHDHDVAVIDTATLGVTYVNSLMTIVMDLAVAPNGTVTAVGTDASNQIRFEPRVRGIFSKVVAASFDPGVPTPATFDLNPHLDYSTPTLPEVDRVESLGDPRTIVWAAGGALAFVAGMGSNNLAVIQPDGTRVATIPVGEGPTGLALSPTGQLFVLNRFEGSISIVDTTALGEIERVDFFDPTPATIKLGRPMLYDTQRTSGLGHVSCATCHIDGRSDGLAWDLGNPQGQIESVFANCRQGPGQCDPYHPMKGPMVTQSLQGIVGNGPMHWRGDRADLPAFSVAFAGLQGLETEPSAAEMDVFEAFVATIAYPPNPNRPLDGSLPAALPVTTGTGNANNGLNLFQNALIFGGALRCTACHTLPTGTDRRIDSPPGLPQSLKDAQLRGMHEKLGFSRASQNNNRGFGYNHDSEFDNLNSLMTAPPFQFPPGGTGAQQRRDLEAFLLALTNDTHAAVGQQVTFDGANNGNANLLNRLTTFVNLANGNQAGLVAKGRVDGLNRGWVYVGGGTYQSDRAGETIASADLLALAASGSEITYTAVPIGTQRRIGIDRDSDGHLDRDEIDSCSDPADASSIPGGPGTGLAADLDGDGAVGLGDLTILLANFGTGGAVPADGDLDGDEDVDLGDLAGLLAQFGTTCPQ